jgi:hypothetical protein
MTCNEDGCEKPVHSKGLCQPHYRQMKRRERGLKPPGRPAKPGAVSHKKLDPDEKARREAARAAETHCSKGHELTPANTYVYPEGSAYPGKKVCKTCRIKSSRKSQGFSGDIDDPVGRWSGAKDKDECANGHSYEEYQPYTDGQGYKHCVVCRDVDRFKARAALYGMTPEELQALIDLQQDICAICGIEADLHIDHDHATGKRRELLCTNCNNGLGRFKDSPVFLRAAIDYLQRHGAIPVPANSENQ